MPPKAGKEKTTKNTAKTSKFPKFNYIATNTLNFYDDGTKRYVNKIACLNANSLPACMKKTGFDDIIYKKLTPDILCIGETKIGKEKFLEFIAPYISHHEQIPYPKSQYQVDSPSTQTSTVFSNFVHTRPKDNSDNDSNVDEKREEKQNISEASLKEKIQILKGYNHVFALPYSREGYSGTCMFVKNDIKIDFVELGVSHDVENAYIKEALASNDKDGFSEQDKRYICELIRSEGRLITLTLPIKIGNDEQKKLKLVHAYVPNSGRAGVEPKSTKINIEDIEKKPQFITNRLLYENFIRFYLSYIQRVSTQEEKLQVIYCGDLNSCTTDLDIWDSKSNQYSAGNTIEEKAAIAKLKEVCSLKDVWRNRHPNERVYSWYSNKGNARQQLKGWRIDYFLVTEYINKNAKDVKIYNEERYLSDHVPILLELCE